jgi:hypothetical protein
MWLASLFFSAFLLLLSVFFFVSGADFPADATELAVMFNLQRIKLNMQSGRTTVLVHCDHLYESLYDLLNQARHFILGWQPFILYSIYLFVQFV